MIIVFKHFYIFIFYCEVHLSTFSLSWIYFEGKFFLGKGHFQGVEKEGCGMKAKKSDVEFIRGSFNEPLIQTWKSFRFLVEFMQASLTLISGIQTQ